jgi:hypothetical protein
MSCFGCFKSKDIDKEEGVSGDNVVGHDRDSRRLLSRTSKLIR